MSNKFSVCFFCMWNAGFCIKYSSITYEFRLFLMSHFVPRVIKNNIMVLSNFIAGVRPVILQIRLIRFKKKGREIKIFNNF